MMMTLKKNKAFIVFSIVLSQLVLFQSCAEDDRFDAYDDLQYIQPTAVFEIVDIDDTTVTFSNSSLDAVAYSWDFDDGIDATTVGTVDDPLLNHPSVFTSAEPTYEFKEAGSYTVVLTAVSSENFINIYEFELNFVDADFSLSINELEVTATNESDNGATYSWDFGDSVGTSTEENPVYTYADGGSYTITLTTTDAFGNSSMTSETIEVAQAGQPTFAAVILNGDMTDTTSAWAVNPDNSSAFNFWENLALEAVVQALPGGTDKPSGSGTSNLTPSSMKLQNESKRMYQPIKIEQDVEYNITAFVKNKSANAGDVVGTFYVMSSVPADESDLAGSSIAAVDVVASATGAWDESTINFVATSLFNFDQTAVDVSATDICTSVEEEWVLLYFVPDLTTAAEVNVDDISIETVGLDL